MKSVVFFNIIACIKRRKYTSVSEIKTYHLSTKETLMNHINKQLLKCFYIFDKIHRLEMMFYVIAAQISSHNHKCFVGIFS